jgi:mono/diheme cytochrome c family protein
LKRHRAILNGGLEDIVRAEPSYFAKTDHFRPRPRRRPQFRNSRGGERECQSVGSLEVFYRAIANPRHVACGLLLLSLTTLPAATTTNIDESLLPPPATNKIDFARDIKPIFDASCIRCHGPVKPKSSFRLDSRATALKGGDTGVDIVPGNSAKSPLIHFTADLVEDMEMPPSGKGDPLNASQIALLRAWIDQGAQWSALPLTNSYSVSLSPTFGGTSVTGDKHKFRELNWQREGKTGGLNDFELFKQTDPNTAILLNGHALNDDYKINLSLQRNDVGFIRSGWEQYRKYYDDTGGFRPTASTPHALSLDQDLHLDIGKAWVDFGLTLPHWARVVLGYEYDYRRGEEATTAWGAAGTGADNRNIGPTSKRINEATHIIKFDLDGDVQGVAVIERFRGEVYTLDTQYTNVTARGGVTQNVKEHNAYFQGANTIRAEKQATDWLFWSAGYLYSKLTADANFTNVTRLSTLTFAGSIPSITLEKESHVVNLNTLLGPFDGLIASVAAQGDWNTQHGFGSGNLNQIPFTRTPPVTLAIEPTKLSANYSESTTLENAALRYTKIPYTVVFAEGRLEQTSISQIDSDLQPTGNFFEHTDFSSRRSDSRLGFSTSPRPWITLTTHYRRYENDSRYPTEEPPEPAGGYPNFFRSRDLLTDEIETKLVLRPCNWLKTTLSYELLTTDFRDVANAASNTLTHVVYSPAGNLLTGRTESSRYSAGAVLTPHPRVYLAASLTYEPSRTHTANSGVTNIGIYHGETYSADASATFVLSQTTDFSMGWYFSQANFGQPKTIVPVGIHYQEHNLEATLTSQFTKNISGRLQYSFDYYHEPSSGGANDFRAHAIFATLNVRLP